MLDPANPYSELFTVSNGGYIPVTNLDVTCTLNFEGSNLHASGNAARIDNFAAYISHGVPVTIPCFGLYTGQVFAGAKLDVEIEYAMYHLNWRALRKHQSFHFQSITGNDGSHHWIFLANAN